MHVDRRGVFLRYPREKKGKILLLWIQYFLFKPQISRPPLTMLNLWWEWGGILLSLERIIYRGELKVTD